MRVLALEPFFGGSHRAFLEGWIDGSRHRWTLLTLPPKVWKWRMRHAPVTLGAQVRQRWGEGERWDAVWASDMLALAEFKGLVPQDVAALPSVLYMHENQLTYPLREPSEKDLHYAFTNLVSAFAADAVWFNSEFHRQDLLQAAEEWMRRMPDFPPRQELAQLRTKSRVLGQGIDIEPSARQARRPTSTGLTSNRPMTIVWAARWEHDKNPQDFFAALSRLQNAGCEFQLIVLGESFRQTPEVFAQAKLEFAGRIAHWGYASSRLEYVDWLRRGDVVVSTAHHEFFGVSVVEAIAAGCVPLLPDRLAYPEILAPMADDARRFCVYDGSVESLVAGLQGLDCTHRSAEGLTSLREEAQRAVERFHFKVLRPRLDAALDDLLGC